MHNLKNNVLIFEQAAKNSFEKALEGRDNLVRLGKNKNVIHLKDIAADNEFSKDTLLASQTIPGIVLLSFAIELSIKQIFLQNTGESLSGHNLRILFNHLNQVQKNLITKRAEFQLQINSEAFDDKLLSNSRGFAEWRYFYENQNQNSSSTEFINSFLESLKQEIEW